MADRGWIAQVAAAAGVAAGTGAAQLGLGYGLGVVVWPSAGTADDSVWLGSLGWATWIAASATVFGAVVASRLRPATPPAPAPSSAAEAPSSAAASSSRAAALPESRSPGGPWRFTLAAAAAIGALLTVALIALPAKDAGPHSDTFSPQVIAGGYALVGVLVGLAIAYWAVVSRPVAANLMATAAWLWGLAAAAVIVDLTLHRSSAMYLTSWQFADLGDSARLGPIYWPTALLTLLAALILGAVAAVPAVRRRDLGVGAATSGAVGPLLVAAAFVLLAPHLTAALGPLESAYLVSPYAVLAGLAGSALTVAVGLRLAARQARRRTSREPRAQRGRLWRGASASDEEPGTATGRAKLPTIAADDSTAPDGASAARGTATAVTERSTTARASSAAGPAARNNQESAAPQTDAPMSISKPARTTGPTNALGRSANTAGPTTTAEPATAAGPATKARPANTSPPANTSGTADVAKSATQAKPATSAAPKKPRGASPVPASRPPATEIPAPPNRSSESSTAKPAAPAPAARKSQARSTVAAPPASPQIAEINPPRPGEPAAAPKPAKAAPKPKPAASTPPPKSAPATEALWVDDSDTPPETPQKRRFGRRSGPTDQPS
jgi:hypothetical protein